MKLAILTLMIISTIIIFGFTDDIISRSTELNKVYYEKRQILMNKYPQITQFMFRPSDRHIIDFTKKAPSDTVTVLVLKVEFLEDTTALTTGNGKMDLRGSMDGEFVTDSTGDSTRNLYYDPPHDSLYFYRHMEALQNYYMDDSHGKLYVDFDIQPKGLINTYTVPHSMKFYGDTINIVQGMFSLLRDAIKEAEIAGLDFTPYDCVIIFHAGSMWQTDMLYDSPFDLPAVYISGADIVFGEPIKAGSREYIDGIIYSETGNQDNGIAYIQGGLVHEFGHQLGLYDLYDTSGRTMGMGGWALMGTGNWNMSGLVPPHHAGYNAYTKYNINPNNNYSNWIYFNQTLTVDSDTEDIKIKYLGANEDTSYKMIKVPINANEYFLIENRFAYMSPDTISDNPDSNGFRVWKDGVLIDVNDYDVSLPLEINTGGLAIYHIDQSIIVADSGMNEINAGYIKGIDMEEADGVQDFEMDLYDITDVDKVFNGSAQDVFYRGGVNASFTPNTMPNTAANNGGKSHIWIYDISMPDTLMTFSVLYDYRIGNFPFTLNSEPDVNAPVPVSIAGDNYIIIQTVSGEIYIMDEQGNPAFSPNGLIAVFDSDNESYSTPAVGNIYGDDDVEIVITSYSGSIHALRTDTVNARNYFMSIPASPFETGDGLAASAVLYDIDNDSYEEILIAGEDMYLHVLNADGDSMIESPGFPIYLGAESWSMPVVADSHIFVLGADGIIHKVDFSGNKVFRSNTENVTFTSSSPAAADIDNDGNAELIFIRGDGSIISVDGSTGKTEFEQNINVSPFYTSPVLGDINSDGMLEIVFFAENKLYALDSKGNVLNNYPIMLDTDQYIQASPILADINNDSHLDILIMMPDGRLDVISDNVTPGLPLQSGQKSYVTPLVCDINDNGNIDIILVGDKQIYAYEMNSGDYSRNWASYHYSSGNNRYYPFASEPYQNSDAIVNGNNNYIYPNPVSDEFTLRFESGTNGDFEIFIFDETGEMKKNQKGIFTEGINETSVYTRDMGAGFYILKLKLIHGSSNTVKTFKFVVRR